MSAIPFDELGAVEAFRDGDAAGFEWLALRYRDRAATFARSLIRDAADAEDLAHEAFVRAWTHREHLQPERGFAPWFFRIVRNLALDVMRHRRILPHEPIDGLRLVAKGIAPDVVANDRLIALRVARALRRLPRQQQRVAMMFFVEGRRHAEIADAMNLPEPTVRSHLSIARKRLRSVLADVAPH